MAQAVAEFQQLLTGLARALGVKIDQLGASLGRLDQRELLAFITDAYPELITPYLAAAADATATWYDEQPSNASTFIARPAGPLPADQLAISGRWAMLQANPSAALQGTATRSVFTSSRDTVVVNAEREHVRWARHASATACGFCRLLATRGAVYRSEASARKGHDHCHCLAVPDRDGRYQPPTYVGRWEKDYMQARKDGARTPAQIAYAMDKVGRLATA